MDKAQITEQGRTPDPEKTNHYPYELIIGLLDYEASQDYYDELKDMGMVPEYPPGSGMELRYIGPLGVERALALELVQAAEALWSDVYSMILESGGLTDWLESHPAMLLDQSLNNQHINAQLAQRLAVGWIPPLVYDVFLTENGPRIMEVQTCWAYTVWEDIISGARGDNERCQSCRFNGDPTELLVQLQELSQGEDITVVDMNPRDGVTAADKIGMAKCLGDENSLPISPLEIMKDDQGYYYMHPETDERINIRHVLCRMLQADLDSLSRVVQELPEEKREEKVRFLLEFFNDAELNWIWHPGWSSIVCKDTLPHLWGKHNTETAYTNHLVPSYGAGQMVSEPGVYVCKPVAGSGGQGQSTIEITSRINYTVPEGYILQEYMRPAIFDVPVPTYLVEEGVLPGMVELRVMPPMHRAASPSSTHLYARLVTRHGISPDGKRYTPQTNTGPATLALQSLLETQCMIPSTGGDNYLNKGSVSPEQLRQLPFGQGPAIIKP